ncbi:MAG: STAS domain-containing protein [Syntrophomonas sp.]
MEFFQVVRDYEEQILKEWYACLTSYNTERYSVLSLEEFEPRMKNIFNNLVNCHEGKLTTEAKHFVYSLAQERMSQSYNYWELLTVFRTMRQALSKIFGPIIFAHDFVQYEKVVMLFEEAYQQVSEGYLDYQISVIEALHKNLLELSTPVIPIADNILVMPLIGTIDTFRADQIMESILNEVTGHQAEVVIIDITGVPVVDTAVANHLLRTVRAIKLVGGECILVGIRPEIAQTIVRLNLSFNHLDTASTLKKGLELARHILNQ